MNELPYLLMIMELCPEDWEEHLDGMNNKVYDDNGRRGNQENGRFWKLQRFSRNELWKNIWCLLSVPTFVQGG